MTLRFSINNSKNINYKNIFNNETFDSYYETNDQDKEYFKYAVNFINDNREKLMFSSKNKNQTYEKSIYSNNINSNIKLFSIDKNFNLSHPKQSINYTMNNFNYILGDDKVEKSYYYNIKDDISSDLKIKSQINDLNENYSQHIVSRIVNSFFSNSFNNNYMGIDNYIQKIILNKLYTLNLKDNVLLKYSFTLNTNSNLIHKYIQLLWELYINNKCKFIIYNQTYPYDFNNIKQDLECLVKGVPTNLFYFNTNSLKIEINSVKNHIRFTGITEKTTEDYLNKLCEFGTKILFLNELVSEVINYFSLNNNSFYLKDFYLFIQKILINISFDVGAVFKKDLNVYKNINVNKNDNDNIKNLKKCDSDKSLFKIDISNLTFNSLYIQINKFDKIVSSIYTFFNIDKTKELFLLERNINVCKEISNSYYNINLDEYFELNNNSYYNVLLNLKTKNNTNFVEFYIETNNCSISYYINYILSNNKTSYLFYSSTDIGNIYLNILNKLLNILYIQLINCLFINEGEYSDIIKEANDGNNIIYSVNVPEFLKEDYIINNIKQMFEIIKIIKTENTEYYNCLSYSSKLLIDVYYLESNNYNYFTINFINKFNSVNKALFKDKINLLKSIQLKHNYINEYFKHEDYNNKLNYIKRIKDFKNEDLLIRNLKIEEINKKKLYYDNLKKQIIEKKLIVDQQLNKIKEQNTYNSRIENIANRIKLNIINKYKEKLKYLENNNNYNDNYKDKNISNKKCISNKELIKYLSIINKEISNFNINKDNKQTSLKLIKINLWKRNRKVLSIKRNDCIKLDKNSYIKEYLDVNQIKSNINLNENLSKEDYSKYLLKEKNINELNKSMNDLSIKEQNISGFLEEDKENKENSIKQINTVKKMFNKSNFNNEIEINIATNYNNKNLNVKDILYLNKIDSELSNLKNNTKFDEQEYEFKTINNYNIMLVNNNNEINNYIELLNSKILKNEDNIFITKQGYKEFNKNINDVSKDKVEDFNNINCCIFNAKNINIINNNGSLNYNYLSKNTFKSNIMLNTRNINTLTNKDVLSFMSLKAPLNYFLNSVFVKTIEYQYSIITTAYYYLLENTYNLNNLLKFINDVFFLARGDLYINFINNILDFRTIRYKSNALSFLLFNFYSDNCFSYNYFNSINNLNSLSNEYVNYSQYINTNLSYKNLLNIKLSYIDSYTLDSSIYIELNCNNNAFKMLFDESIVNNLSSIHNVLFRYKRNFVVLNNLLEIINEKKKLFNLKRSELIKAKNKINQVNNINEINQACNDYYNELLNNYLSLEAYINRRNKIISNVVLIINEVFFYLNYSLLNNAYKNLIVCKFKYKNVLKLKQQLSLETNAILFKLNNFKLFKMFNKLFTCINSYYLIVSISFDEDLLSNIDSNILLKDIQNTAYNLKYELYNLKNS